MDKELTKTHRKKSTVIAGLSEGVTAVKLIMSMFFVIIVAASVAGHLVLRLCFGRPEKADAWSGYREDMEGS